MLCAEVPEKIVSDLHSGGDQGQDVVNSAPQWPAQTVVASDSRQEHKLAPDSGNSKLTLLYQIVYSTHSTDYIVYSTI